MDIKNIKEIDDGKYEIYFSYVDDLTGKRRRVRRRFGCTLSEAIEHRDRLKEQANAGTLYQSDRAEQALSAWLDEYLDHREHVDQVAPSTLRNESAIYRSNILPDVGDWRPEAIELHHLDQLVDRWLDDRKNNGERYSPTTIRNRVSYLIRFLRWVFKKTGRNPAFLRDVKKPKKRKGKARRGRSLSPDEVRQLFTELAPFWSTLAYTLLVTGQRWGSVTALRWDDIDFADEQITFTRSHYKGRIKQGNKSGDIVRIPMPNALSNKLKAHRERMMADQRPGIETGLVFPARVQNPDDASNNGFIEATSLRKQMHRACDDLGMEPCSPHDLRRTHNTWLVEQGIEGTIIRSITGHSDSAMTDHYYRGSQTAKSDALGRVVELVD